MLRIAAAIFITLVCVSSDYRNGSEEQLVSGVMNSASIKGDSIFGPLCVPGNRSYEASRMPIQITGALVDYAASNSNTDAPLFWKHCHSSPGFCCRVPAGIFLLSGFAWKQGDAEDVVGWHGTLGRELVNRCRRIYVENRLDEKSRNVACIPQNELYRQSDGAILKEFEFTSDGSRGNRYPSSLS